MIGNQLFTMTSEEIQEYVLTNKSLDGFLRGKWR
jgi:hypothetical protein